MTANADDFREPAKRAYTALKPAFKAEERKFFWRLGHAFDTVIDYLANVDRTEANTVAHLAIDKYNDGGGAWYDDFAWWGIAGLRAAQRADLFGGRTGEFRQVALNSWKTLDDNAPYGWQRADHVTFADYKPLVDHPLVNGGVWNHIIDDGCNPSASCQDGLCGRQNTVTNASYLLLATRAYLDKTVTNPAFKTAMNRQYAFFHTWFTLKDPEHALLYFYQAGQPGKAVVRERVGRFYKDGVTDAKYRWQLAWAGDQGLVLSALVDHMRLVPSGSPEYEYLLTTARQLIAGTRDYLVDRDMDARGILRPWWPDPAPGGDEDDPWSSDDDDYWTGIGVYMRSLLYAYQTNAELKHDLQQKDAEDFIRANAEYVAKHPHRSTSADKVVNLTNNLATLVAAVGMLPAKSARQ